MREIGPDTVPVSYRIFTVTWSSGFVGTTKACIPRVRQGTSAECRNITFTAHAVSAR